jgi:hypothetical protein
MGAEFLRQGSNFMLDGVAHTIYQVRGEVKATAREFGVKHRVWASREDFERETGLKLLPGRAAEMPAYEPKEWDDARLRYAVNYTEADIYAEVADDLKLTAIAKLNEIERLMVDAASSAARDEYDRHKAHITGTMARYAAAMHNIGIGRKNFTEERAAGDLVALRDYLRLTPGHDRRGRVFHVDPEMSDMEMRELACCYPAADQIEAVSHRRPTEHEYIRGSRQLPPTKLAQAVLFYGHALDYQREVLARETAEYEELRSFGPDAVSDETAEKWHGRRDVALEAALQSKLSSIALAKGNIARLEAKISEVREEMKGRTSKRRLPKRRKAARTEPTGAGAQTTLF